MSGKYIIHMYLIRRYVYMPQPVRQPAFALACTLSHAAHQVPALPLYNQKYIMDVGTEASATLLHALSYNVLFVSCCACPKMASFTALPGFHFARAFFISPPHVVVRLCWTT